MIVVANSGPLMAIGKLGLIYLLHPLYDSVLIPSGVYQEVVIAGLELEQPDAYAVRFAVARGEIIVVNLEDADLSQAVQVLPIHRGEKQAIQLGLNKTADWVLLDDQLAREHAQRLGLKVKGTLGIIVEATIEGVGLLIAFNVKFLREVLEVIKTPNVALETSAANAPGVIRPVGDDNFLHVIMPMHLG